MPLVLSAAARSRSRRRVSAARSCSKSVVRVSVSQDHGIDVDRTRSCFFQVDQQLTGGWRDLPSPCINQDLILAGRDQQAGVGTGDLIGAETVGPQLFLEALLRHVGEKPVRRIRQTAVAQRSALVSPTLKLYASPVMLPSYADAACSRRLKIGPKSWAKLEADAAGCLVPVGRSVLAGPTL